MRETGYGFGVDVAAPFDVAIQRTTDALKAEGFGILSTIDVQATLKQKLSVDFRRYVILGACNPPLAYRAFEAELEVGLLLPCNVIVYEIDAGHTGVSAMAPLAAMGLVGTAGVTAVAREADAKLRRALAALAAPQA
jgi:uncharacterized protein (DUF302 family)